MFKTLAKRLVGLCVSEYRINWIYAARVIPRPGDDGPVLESETAAHRAALCSSSTAKMRNSQRYAKAGLAGLVLVEAGRPVSIAHFAETSQYNRASTWPLRNNEVALMDIATEADARGRGLAPNLIRAATRRYLTEGRGRMIAFIWWSNTPSLRAFKKAGWKRIGFSMELRFGKHWLKLRVPLP